jgi:hypothetical protein
MSKRKLEIDDAGGVVDLTPWQIGNALTGNGAASPSRRGKLG